MVLVKGICKNFGECDLADNKEIQEVEKTNFVCSNPDCGKPLHEIKPTKPPKSPVIWIVAAILLVCGVGMAAYWYWSRHSDAQPPAPVPIEHIVVNPTECCLNIGDSVLVMVEIYPPEATDDMVWISSNPDVAIITDGFIKALSRGQTTITISSNDGNASAAVAVNIVSPVVLPSPKPPVHEPTSPTSYIKIPDEVQDAIDMLIDQSLSMESRLVCVPRIIDKFFDSSAKVEIGDVIKERKNVKDYFREIVINPKILEVEILWQNENEKIIEMGVLEVRK